MKEIGMDREAATDYPRIYRPSIISRIIFTALGLLLIFNAFLLIFAPDANAFTHLIAAFLAIGGVFISASAMTSKITLYRDRIEQRLLFTNKTLLRAEIIGYRTRTVKGNKYVDLIPENENLKKITVSSICKVDGAFDAWLQGLRDLGSEDKKAIDQEIMNDISLGDTPDERLARVRTIRTYTNYSMIGVMVFIVILCVFPHPRWLATSAPIVCPWIAIIMIFLWGNNFTIIELDKISAQRKANIIQLIFIPATAYFVLFSVPRHGIPVMPLDWHKLIIPSIVIALIMTSIIWIISQNRTINPIRLTGLLILPLTIYSGGTIAMVNGLFDHNPAKIYTLMVQNKYQTTGKGAANYLQVASADRSYKGLATLRVPFDLYRSTEIGGSVCAHIHSGALGMAWEKLDHCSDSNLNSPRRM